MSCQGIGPHAGVVFGATHGTAWKREGQDKVNPDSVILSGVMMLARPGRGGTADPVVRGIERTIADGFVAYDLTGRMEGAKGVRATGPGQAIAERTS